jgi:beta-lactamase superfamily II metal-dependent hydrolase
MLALAGTTSLPVSATVTAVPCSTSGTWTQGEMNIYWLNVGQGDSQFIVGPTGKTLLIDAGETSFNTTGTNTKTYANSAKLRQICGTGTSPVALDYVMASHHHLDHIGYSANPTDTANYGNGLYQLLTPGGLGFTVGTFLDHDGGTWVDTNGNGVCDPGNSTTPSNEIQYHNAGTTSTTAARFICWLYGPAAQADRSIINGHVLTLTNNASWPSLDLGPGVTATILNANGKGTFQADGVTPVSGDHTAQGGSGPPSENDYSIALKISYGKWSYATAGDSDGEYNTSANGYTYNNIEAKLAPLFGNVDTMRANHHGSDHSSSDSYLNVLRPESVFVSCGSNSYGHPGNRMLNSLRNLVNDRGVGADIYLANNPCDPTQADGTTPTNYSGTFNSGGDVVLHTGGSGNTYTITYDVGTRSYSAYGATPTPTPTPTPTATPTPLPPDPSKIVIN